MDMCFFTKPPHLINAILNSFVLNIYKQKATQAIRTIVYDLHYKMGRVTLCCQNPISWFSSSYTGNSFLLRTNIHVLTNNA